MHELHAESRGIQARKSVTSKKISSERRTEHDVEEKFPQENLESFDYLFCFAESDIEKYDGGEEPGRK